MATLKSRLVTVYVGLALFAFLYTYPWTPGWVSRIIVAAGLAWAAAYLSTTAPLFTNLVYAASVILSALTLAIAIPKPWFQLILLDPTFFTIVSGFTLLLVALIASAKRKDVTGLATGTLSAATIRFHNGVYLAPALLAIYASISGSAKGAFTAVLIEAYIHFFVLMGAWALGNARCFADLDVKGLNPVKPLVEALFSPSVAPVTPNKQLYTLLAYSLIHFTLLALIVPSVAMLARYAAGKMLRAAPHVGVLSKGVIVSTPLLTLLAYFSVIDSETLVSHMLGCRYDLRPYDTLMIGGIVALLSLLYKLVELVGGISSVREEKESIMETINTYLHELQRIKDELMSRKLYTPSIARLVEGIEEEARKLQNQVEKAGLLDIPMLSSLLTLFEEEFRKSIDSIISQFRAMAREIVNACNAISSFAAQNRLPEDCREATETLSRMHSLTDAYNTIVLYEEVKRAFNDYLQTLLEEIEAKAEMIGVRLEGAPEWSRISELLKGIERASSPEEIRRASQELLEALSRVWGRIKAHEV